MFTIVNRYICREITIPFVLSVVALTSIALLGKLLKLLELVVNKGLGFITLIKLIIFATPFILVYVFPISFLLAVLVAYNRLSGDGEIIAFKASGLSFKQLAMPAMTLSLLPFLLTLTITLYLFPRGNLEFKRLLYDLAVSKVNIGLTEKTFIDEFDDLVIYTNELSVNGREMKGIFIVDGRENDAPNIVVANRGVILADPNLRRITFRLTDGSIHSEEGEKMLIRKVNFKNYDINLTQKGAEEYIPQKNRELFFMELYKKIKDIKKAGGEASPHIIDLHKRLTLPFAIFIFTIIGVSIGSQWNREGKLRGFTIALVIILIYYFFSTLLEFFGEDGSINPILAVWGSNGILGTMGLYLFYRASNY